MTLIKSLIGAVTGPVFDVIDKAVTDKDEAARLKAALQQRLIEQQDARLQARMKIILAEATGESWLQRNWRPLLMTIIAAIVTNNYLIAPYLGAMFGIGLQLALPDRLWDLMTLGVGGYIAGRSGEKIADKLKRPGGLMDRIDTR
ncbi:Holin of 3TMs, for gene-transfer release [Modicisalibacter ilicicola DSM 19980]|uniref:Holin of 3TMs, for gene-transfer release n=1 Tax=Modicisalibacter ilicicola DSM 19980 TaxID=1121942 RepID=A0A1M4Y4I2_9GAMM|nr:3TM-type holin [Halomonas ilicicola]SHF00493.1 Holin of 3TMs, for gene-transfer release [Halomonas ilicicola DSM 19980]